MSLLRASTRMAAYGATTLDRPSAWLIDSIGRRTTSGEMVSDERALGIPAYYAMLRNSGQDVAKLPAQMRRRFLGSAGSRQVFGREHPVARLLRRPNPAMGWKTFVQCLQPRALGQGNGYAEIVRSQDGSVELWPIHPSRMKPRLSSDGRNVVYEWTQDQSTKIRLESRDVFHIKGMGDGIEGYSVVRALADTLGIALAGQKHAGAMWGEGLAKRLVIVAKNIKTPEAKAALRKELQQDRENDPIGARKLPFLPGDIDIHDYGIDPVDAQFLEGQQFSVEQIARIGRMSLAKLQYFVRAQGWSTLEALNTDYANDHLVPWIETWVEEMWLKLLTEQEQADDLYFFKFVLQGLLRGDTAARVSYYDSGKRNGWLSSNDIRNLEDMNPIADPAADAYVQQAQMTPISGGNQNPVPSATFTAGADVAPEPMALPMRVSDPVSDFMADAETVRPVLLAEAQRFVVREVKRTKAAIVRYASNPARYGEWERKWREARPDDIALAFAPAGTALEEMAARRGVVGVGGPPALRSLAAVAPDFDKGENEQAADLAARAFDALTADVEEAPDA